MWQSYLNGLLVAAGLIIAIGAQNAFVLAQSLRREHHLPVAALCVLCDALLVAAGVFGLAAVLAQNPTLLAVARWGAPPSCSGWARRHCAGPSDRRPCSSRTAARARGARCYSPLWR